MFLLTTGTPRKVSDIYPATTTVSVGEQYVLDLESKATTDGNTAASSTVRTALVTLLDDLEDAEILDNLDLLYVFATNGDAGFAKYNVLDPTGDYNVIETGAGALTFTSLQGFTGDGTNYFDSNFFPGVAPATPDNFSLNSASAGFYCRTAGNDLNIMSNSTIIVGANAGNYYYRINSNTPSGTVTAGDVQGLLAVNRDASNSCAIYKNGSSARTDTASSTALTNAFYILRRAGAGQSTKQVSMAFLGGNLTPTQHSALYTAFQAYMTTLGTQV